MTIREKKWYIVNGNIFKHERSFFLEHASIIFT